tara:strand:+ start:359 stop:2074 length:1716 start_codon:yes stop_codon:yes gene_type:complete
MVKKRDYSDWSKTQLIKEVKKLEKRKKFGIVWEDKPEDVAKRCKNELPVLKEDTEKEIKTDDKKPINILIEGDNYHALSVLNYTHKGKVDVIYIDPPYNTGAQDWKYNNNYVDNNDQWRHSKWLSFMEKRIKLAKNLLKTSGFFVISIDHFELFALGLLCDEIFNENNRIGIVAVVHKPEGRNQAKFFGNSHEYLFFYAKNKNKCSFSGAILNEETQKRYSKKDEKGKYLLKNFIRLTDGKYSLRENKPHFFYPVYVSKDFKKFSLEKNKEYFEVLPITKSGQERTWKTTPKTLLKRAKEGEILAIKDEKGRIELFEKLREDEVLKTHWIDPRYHAYHHGTKIVENILGEKRFEFPKSINLIYDIIKITTKKKAVVLDFFAGSGTTGHAVLELNKEDEGNRKFILCTNNENNNGNGNGGIMDEVCYPRVKKVIENLEKESKGKLISNRPSGLKYFKTDFVDAEPTDENKRKMVDKSTEMLCLKEDCFDEVKKGTDFKIFKNSQDKHLGIIFDDGGIEPFKKEVKKLNKQLVVYVFSLDESAREEEFEDMTEMVELRPIPAVILNVYKRIFK